jgi:hypothetical protein
MVGILTALKWKFSCEYQRTIYKTRSVWPAVIIHHLNNFPFDYWLNHFN